MAQGAHRSCEGMADMADKPDKPIVQLTVGNGRPGRTKRVIRRSDLPHAPVFPALVQAKPNPLLLFLSRVSLRLAGSLAAVGFLAGSFLLLAVSLRETTLTRFGEFIYALTFVFGTLLLGTALYFFRCRWIGVYGMIEIGVGVGTTIF